jgi:predicted AlkP superfamily phosphohydrolase/phosphomutase
MSRVLVLGIDRGTFRILDRLIQRNLVPNFARMMNLGSRGVLRSTIPDVTPPSWTSMVTGVNPGKHGIFDLFKFQENSMNLITSADRKSKAV